MTPITALGSRYGIQGALGRSVKRAAAGGGWWLAGGIAAANCIAAYQPKGAASYAASKVNLANAGTYDAISGNSHSAWDASYGWDFVAANAQWISTEIASNAITSFIIRYSDMPDAESYLGTRNSNYYGLRFRPQYGLTYYLNWGSNAINAANANPVGNHVVGMSNAGSGYYDGAKAKTLGAAGTSYDSKFFIGAASFLSGSLGNGTYKVQAAAFYSVSIDDYIAGLTTAMNAL